MVDIQTAAVLGAVLSVVVGATGLSGRRLARDTHSGLALKSYALILAGLVMGVSAFWL